MPCIEVPARRAAPHRSGRLRALAVVAALLAASCAAPPPPSPSPSPPPAVPGRPAPAPAPAPSIGGGVLPAPKTPRSMQELRAQAALRIVAANPGMTYDGKVPDILLAIPVLEIELNADGSIRRIDVMREPRQAKDTIKLAIDAVKRAAPFGSVAHLPKPWKFQETFLFNDDRKFKPRTLDS